VRGNLGSGVEAAVAVLVALGAGCSQEGTLVVHNRTNTQFTGSVDDRGFALSGYERIEFTIQIGDQFLIFGDNEKDVVLEGESCTCFPMREPVTVSDGETTELPLLPDAVCVVFQNGAECDVDEVFARLSGATDWGQNVIDGVLATAEAERHRFSPGSYEFLLVDECGDSTEVEHNMAAGETQYVVHAPPLARHGDRSVAAPGMPGGMSTRRGK